MMAKDIFELLEQSPTLIFLWPKKGFRFQSLAWDLKSDTALGAPRSKPFQLEIVEELTPHPQSTSADYPILSLHQAATGWRPHPRFQQAIVLLPNDVYISSTQAATVAQALARVRKPQDQEHLHPYWAVCYELDDETAKWTFHPPNKTSPEDIAFFNTIPKWNGTPAWQLFSKPSSGQ